MTGPDPNAAISRYRRHAAGYDESARRTLPLRARTIARLGLSRGQTVLDVGCGTGLSFALLRQGVGESGRVIGVELSPDMMGIARQRVAREGWKNVSLIESAVEHAPLDGPFDAVLFNYAHDVLRSAPALAHIFGRTRPGGRVAVAGMRFVTWWLAPVNLYVMITGRPYMTTFDGLGRPWSLLEPYLERFDWDRTLLGTGYVGHGVVRANAQERR